MRVIRTVAELREHLGALRIERPSAAAQAAGEPSGGVGFVPTMGALHEGHLSLVGAAREAHATVVLSIFVNPRQFDDGGDLAAYPRDEDRDFALARAAGVDVVFAPEAAEMYPEGFGTTVSVDARLTDVLEGAVRGGAHFDGVATVVCKLLVAVQPDAAYFGEKDFQQLVVVRRMARDLALPVRIVGCPTVREPDGLARSSRNVRLSPEQRRAAAAIPRALAETAEALARGEADLPALRARALETIARAGLDCEYFVFVHPETLEPVTTLAAPAVCAVAARAGAVRLIDNLLLTPPAVE